MRIGDIVTKNPITVVGETSISEAMKIMKENNTRRLPVVDKGKLVGMVTEKMILEASPSPATDDPQTSSNNGPKGTDRGPE